MGLEEVFHGKRVSLLRGTVELPDGRSIYREIVVFPESVAIVPVKNDGSIVLIRQYRAPVRDWIIEIPAGVVEPGEEPREAARRELIEETGYEPGKLVEAAVFYVSPGYSTEKMHLYIATGLRYVGARPESYELIELYEKPLAEAVEMIRRGEIRDAKTILGILYYLSLYRPSGPQRDSPSSPE